MSLRRVLSTVAVFASVAVLAGCSNGDNPTAADIPTDSSAPAAPVVQGTTFNGSADVLDWNASASANVSGYEIYFYSPSPTRDNSFVLVGTVGANETEFVLPGGSGTEYFRVRAISSTGVRSASSATATVERSTPMHPGGNDRDPSGPGLRETL